MSDDAHLGTIAELVSRSLDITTKGVDAAAVASVEVSSNVTRRTILPDLDGFRGSFVYVAATALAGVLMRASARAAQASDHRSGHGCMGGGAHGFIHLGGYAPRSS